MLYKCICINNGEKCTCVYFMLYPGYTTIWVLFIYYPLVLTSTVRKCYALNCDSLTSGRGDMGNGRLIMREIVSATINVEFEQEMYTFFSNGQNKFYNNFFKKQK